MSHSFQFRIEKPDAGQRLDEFFASRFGSLSRMRIANLIETGACLVNGAAGQAGYRVLMGDSVGVSFDDGAPTAMSPEPISLEIIHEDDHLLVVVKPAGMLVHPTMGVKTGTLANALAYYLNREFFGSEFRVPGSELELNQFNQNLEPGTRNPEPPSFPDGERHSLTRPGMVHRLDRATSGLMVIAKTPRALTVLCRHFRRRLVEKRYLALVHGKVDEEAGSIDAPIGRDPDHRPRWRVMEGGKPAETRFSVLERLGRATLLELVPVTGRTNQLRIHCALIGHPIVGDEMHGNIESRISNCGLKTEGQGEAQQFAIRNPQFEIRLCLHAWKLAFYHPASGDWMEFASPLPIDIAGTVAFYRR
jgi:23S rRNA pseudouridine1911/1915/1917 synthase